MRIKNLLSITVIALCSAIFMACDDDLNSIGGNIQPDGDGIYVGVDTVTLKAITISLEDSIYARTPYPLLGQYDDPIFGRVKSDYLCELFSTDEFKFEGKVSSIDSVYLSLVCTSFTGDSISPMGISVYEVTKPIKANFFTNINPANYTDNMSTTLGRGIFTIKDAPYVNGMKLISTQLNQALGQRFYNEWKREGSTTFDNPDELRKFFKGMYVTTTLGSGSLLNVGYNLLEIYYTIDEGRNAANTADSTRVGLFRLPSTPEVIQATQIRNSIPERLFADSLTKTYLKTPAGVATEIIIPLKEIMNKTGKDKAINTANFSIKGFTEEEERSQLSRPKNLLLINRDSLPNFFINRKLPDSKTSFVIERTSSTNTYNFGNIASIISYYANIYKDATNIPDLRYVVIPVQVSTTTSTTNTGSQVATLTGVFNLMNPTSAILRTDEENMRMSLIFSKYNNRLAK